jgi:hypothetical protein
MTIRRLARRGRVTRAIAVTLSLLLLGSGDAMLLAQDAAPAADAAADAPKLSNDELESLVAPIALYPDPLLSQALVASTYPLELIQAQQWLAKNSTLKGDALSDAAEKQDWDPSVQATVVLPDLLKRLTEDITWTTNLGNAFLDQQDDVMDAVQRLRAKAKGAGKLDTTEQQKVETKTVESKTVIEIQPASTQVVYVPTYSPTVIWGPPVYPYPPVYYPPYTPGAALFTFGMGMAVGAAISGGGWGWGCGWGHGGNNIYINNNNNFVRNTNIKTGNINSNNVKNSNWQHNSNHRGGAPYSNKATANKYGGNTRGGSATQQARGGASASNRQASSRAGGASATSANRGGGAGNMSANRASSGGGDRVGNRSIPKTSSGGNHSFSGASGGASSANRARASSSRGASSMGSRGGGGGRRR